jgi:hypothetical protein
MQASELRVQLQGNQPAPMLDRPASCTLALDWEEPRAATTQSPLRRDPRHPGRPGFTPALAATRSSARPPPSSLPTRGRRAPHPLAHSRSGRGRCGAPARPVAPRSPGRLDLSFRIGQPAVLRSGT